MEKLRVCDETQVSFMEKKIVPGRRVLLRLFLSGHIFLAEFLGRRLLRVGKS